MISTAPSQLPAVLLLLICSLSGCAPGELDYAVGTLERDRIHLAADSSEPLISIEVREGDTVSAGTVLLRQSSERITASIAAAEARLRSALAKLEEAEQGPRTQEIDQARARQAAAASRVVTTRSELERERSLVAENYTSANRIDRLEGALNEATAEQQEAAAALALALAGTRREIIEQASAAVAGIQAELDALRITLERTTVVSPVAGTVDALPLELGERPQPGQTLAVVLADGRTYARVHVPQPLRTRLQSGDRALVRVDGLDGDFAARVRWISMDAAFTPYFALTQHDRSRLAYLAEVDLLQPVDLPMGIPVEVRFPDLEVVGQ